MNLQEHIRTVLREYWKPKQQNNDEVDHFINKIAPREYPWFKKIKINEMYYSSIAEAITLYGVIEVDATWGEERWEDYNGNKPFLKNKGWEDNDPVKFGDLIDMRFEKELSEYFGILLMSVTEYSPIQRVRLGNLKVIFI